MAKIINLRAPDSMKLARMKSAEIEKYVSQLSDEALERLPKEMRPVGVNAVALQQLIPGTAADGGVWAQWTRACCDRRKRIDDFVDPVVDQFELPGSPVARQLEGQHLESQMRVQELEHPTRHRKA